MLFFVEIVLKQKEKEKKVNVARVYVLAENQQQAEEIIKEDFKDEFASIFIEPSEQKIIRIPSIKRTKMEQLNIEFLRKKK